MKIAFLIKHLHDELRDSTAETTRWLALFNQHYPDTPGLRPDLQGHTPLCDLYQEMAEYYAVHTWQLWELLRKAEAVRAADNAGSTAA
jgi:hypothetical protein